MGKSKICFACIIRASRKGYTLEIPDFNITVAGKSYIDVVANGIEVLTALFSYRVERNIPIQIAATFESCMEMIRKEKGQHSVYMLQPSTDLL